MRRNVQDGGIAIGDSEVQRTPCRFARPKKASVDTIVDFVDLPILLDDSCYRSVGPLVDALVEVLDYANGGADFDVCVGT